MDGMSTLLKPATDAMFSLSTNAPDNFRQRWIDHIIALQEQICAGLEEVDGVGEFQEDLWKREGGGGGRTRIITGNVLEKGGVNISAVDGPVTDLMRQQLNIDAGYWFACGLSLVLHPYNPMVPTVHANWRYFELYDEAGNRKDSWFGGGSDLTPYYVFPEDGSHFHRTLMEAMQPFGEDLYPKYKKQCDEYFVNKHRNNEARGIGGVFYDHLRPTENFDTEKLFAFQQAQGAAFLPAYLPIVLRRRELSFGSKEKDWQEIRRGRYAEFNLLHDRGTLFGLKTGGRIESILMSLPPRARWDYNDEPASHSKEAELLEYLKPRDWVGEEANRLIS
jgi:coproporphyrinogen III oxidase